MLTYIKCLRLFNKDEMQRVPFNVIHKEPNGGFTILIGLWYK